MRESDEIQDSAGYKLWIYRCLLLSIVTGTCFIFPILLNITWPLILIGIAGYLSVLINGVRIPKYAATYKIMLLFEIWMFFWNGFRWKNYTKT